jgi:hypothetical protein
MASNSYGNPMVLVTTTAATLRNTSNTNLPANQSISVRKVVWDGPTAAGNFSLQYGDGTTLLSGTAGATTNPNPITYDFPGGLPVYDFKVATVSSGTILLYY